MRVFEVKYIYPKNLQHGRKDYSYIRCALELESENQQILRPLGTTDSFVFIDKHCAEFKKVYNAQIVDEIFDTPE